MGTPPQGEKRKRTPDPDEVVDLDALAREYEEKYSGPDYEDLPKRKNEDILRAEERRRPSADESDVRREARSEVARELKQAGVEIRDAIRQVRDDVRKAGGDWNNPEVQQSIKNAGKNFGDKFGKGFGQSFGKGFESFGKNAGDFFSHPYSDDYQEVVMEETTAEERSTAAMAHLSSLLTFGAGIFSAGALVPLLIFIPLFIYLKNRHRSPYVARHALQAFTAQVAGTFGWLAVIVGTVTVGIVLSIILAITIVGIIAIPFLWLAIILVLIVSVAMPIGMAGFGVAGAVAAANGRNYKYPYVSKWTDRRAKRGSRIYRESY